MTHDVSRNLPFLAIRHGVLLPGALSPIPVGRPQSLVVANGLKPGDRLVFGIQYQAELDEPQIADLHPVGVVAEVRDIKKEKRRITLLVETTDRVKLVSLHSGDNGYEAAVEDVEEERADTELAHVRAGSLRDYLGDLGTDGTIQSILESTDRPGLLADRVASFIDAPNERKVEVLRLLDVEARLELVTELLKEARARAELKEKIDSEVRTGLSKQQREIMLRQQLQAIQKELGEGDDDESDIDRLRAQLDEAELPAAVRKVADRELRRLDGMTAGHAEGHVIRNYLEWIASLPWSKRAESTQEIDAIAAALDEDHYGLDEVKRRILEHMAVLKLSAKSRGTILALVGPPGVGKTSLAQSVARATGRPLARVSLGGVRDESELRGHRRTYVGALPGRIVAALRRSGVKNPVMVLDEVDKLGRSWAGDPEAALLEILDPEQNATFTDHYLDLPFDLSEVLFIATANELSNVSPPLRDRLEVIEINGYTIDEKVRIGLDHLWPRKLEEHGLEPDELSIDADAVAVAIKEYTREAGVRQLGRELAKICRSLALEAARGGATGPVVSEKDVRRILGRPKFLGQTIEDDHQPGIAAGLAWTPVGGEVLYVETTQMPGKGKVEITGKLGDVMNESARAALAYLRSHADEVGADPHFLDRHDLHIHVPSGAVPKDGPSAGVTMFTALASLVSGRRVRPDTAMTGEATLRGRVLPVGGIKSKVLAAHRAGFKRVILPRLNERDLDDVPESVRNDLEIVLAADMAEVLAAALCSEGGSLGLPPGEGEPPKRQPVGEAAVGDATAPPAAHAGF